LAYVTPILVGLSCAEGAEYYVSASGSDGALGTLDEPFRTIQKAASVMVAGDTAYIRAGVYRETVTPSNSGTQTAPITFASYNGEAVVVSGADVVPSSSWSLSTGKIYKTNSTWDLGQSFNQIFIDGQMMIEARWPNTTLDVSHPTLARATGGSYVDGGTGPSTGTITDPNLSSWPDNYWNGATIMAALGTAWVWQVGSVVSSTKNPGQLSFIFTKLSDSQTPGADTPYFLTGRLSELDAAGEWFLDSPSATLYLWTLAGDSPTQHLVEAKHRQLAFNLNGVSFITVRGVGIFAATISSDSNSQYLVLDGLKLTYESHYSLLPPSGQTVYTQDGTSGILVNGTNNVVRNSTIAYSAGGGINILGSGHRVFNNVIHDADYTPDNYAPIIVGANDVILAYNTLYNAGRAGVDHYALRGGRILHNEIYDVALQTNDTGCTYTYESNGNGTEIAYNLCHDVHGLPLSNARPYSNGIYVDNNSSNYVVHHNVVWGTEFSAALNSVSTNNKAFNNTYAGVTQGLTVYSLSGPASMPGTEIENNIFTAPIPATPGALVQNNILAGTNPQFVDPANNNYQLQPNSPAIGAGLVIPPYTDGYSGNAPDLGAYDHTKPAWKAGAQPAAYTLSSASYMPGLAPGSAAVAFGTAPFDQGVSVLVTDGAGADLPATMLYSVASPPQLAFVVPAAAATGVAMITITNGDGTISLSSAPIFQVAPGLFSADSSGSGIAAAEVLTVAANGSQTYSPVASYDPTLGIYVPIPIDPSSPTDQVFLILYGTGIRGRSSLNGVTVSVGGVNTQVTYAGSQNQFPGLDQVDVLLPGSLAGKGTANIALTVDGQPANVVTVTVE
jgi:uncharacterized protein (TIGR03437 family)